MINIKDNLNDVDNEQITITLTLDDGTDLICEVVSIFEADNKDYIALLPINNAEDEEVEMMLFRYKEFDDEEISIENISTDEEFEIALSVFDNLIE